MGDNKKPQTLPWIQALALAVLCFVVWIDAVTDSWNPSPVVYFVVASAIVGAGPGELIDMLKAWRRR